MDPNFFACSVWLAGPRFLAPLTYLRFIWFKKKTLVQCSMLHYTFIHCKFVYRVRFCCRLTDLMNFLKPVHVGRKSGSISLFIASSFFF